FDVAALAGAPVKAGQQRPLAAGIENVGIERTGCDVAAFAPAHIVVGRPHAAPAEASAAAALHADSARVLLRPTHLIGIIPGQRHVVDLRRRIILAGPGLPVVGGDGRPAVVAHHHALIVGGVNPD